MVHSIRVLNNSIEEGRKRSDPPPFASVEERVWTQALKKLLAQTTVSTDVSTDQLDRVASLALKQLTNDLEKDPEGARSRILQEWIDAWNEPTPSGTQGPTDRQTAASAAALPILKGALDLAVQAAGLPVGISDLARKKIATLSMEAVSEVVKDLIKEAIRAGLGWVGLPTSTTTVTVKCECCPEPRPDKLPGPLSFEYFFDPDSDVVLQEPFRAAIAKTNPQLMADLTKWQWSLRAYTDRTGTEEHNRDLAQRRGDAVSKQLQAMGVALVRIHKYAMAEQGLPIPTQRGVSVPYNRVVKIEAR